MALVVFFVLSAGEARARPVAVTVEETLSLAREHNPDLDAAMIESERSEAAVKIESASWAPLIFSELSFTRASSSVLSPNGVSTSASDIARWDAGVSKRFSFGTQITG